MTGQLELTAPGRLQQTLSPSQCGSVYMEFRTHRVPFYQPQGPRRPASLNDIKLQRFLGPTHSTPHVLGFNNCTPSLSYPRAQPLPVLEVGAAISIAECGIRVFVNHLSTIASLNHLPGYRAFFFRLAELDGNSAGPSPVGTSTNVALLTHGDLVVPADHHRCEGWVSTFMPSSPCGTQSSLLNVCVSPGSLQEVLLNRSSFLRSTGALTLRQEHSNDGDDDWRKQHWVPGLR
jgi:hypothetical protein